MQKELPSERVTLRQRLKDDHRTVFSLNFSQYSLNLSLAVSGYRETALINKGYDGPLLVLEAVGQIVLEVLIVEGNVMYNLCFLKEVKEIGMGNAMNKVLSHTEDNTALYAHK